MIPIGQIVWYLEPGGGVREGRIIASDSSSGLYVIWPSESSPAASPAFVSEVAVYCVYEHARDAGSRRA